MAKKRRRRRHDSASEAALRTIYVPVIHGIRTASLADWTARSVTPLVRWWETCGGARRVGCPARCQLLRWGLTTRGAVKPVAFGGSWVLCSPLLVVLPRPVVLVVFGLLVGGVSLAVSRRSRRRLRKTAAACDAAPVRVASAAAIRERSRSPVWALVQATLALPLIGGGAMTIILTDAAGSPPALQAVEQLSGGAFLLGLAIALSAWAVGTRRHAERQTLVGWAAYGSRRADRAAMCALAASALLWALHDTSFGMIAASIYLAGAAWAGARLLRFPDPLSGVAAA